VNAAGVVESYVRAWHEHDPAERRRLLEESWAEYGVYTDPNSIIEGRDALVDFIAEFHAQRPDVRIEVRSRIDEVGRQFRFVWATVEASGAVLRQGIDVGQLDAEGRIEWITGFFDIVP
jgi:hypothetical protein